GSTFWARQANVYVGGGWGTVKLGRQFAASYLANGAYDLTGQANYSVLDQTFGGDTYPYRGDSAIAYVTPNMGGFQAAIAYLNKNSGGINTDPAKPQTTWTAYGKNAWDIGAWYKSGALSAGIGANKDVIGTKTNYHLGAKYGFGNFTVGAGWHKGATKRGFNLGASAKFGAFTVTLDAVRVTKVEGGGKKFTSAVLDARYALSKRTFVYADILRLGNKDDDKTGWGLGIRHNF
ncbi:MAG: porin, partial [Ottowia sp.]|nr:porin [Ottowia sp.]